MRTGSQPESNPRVLKILMTADAVGGVWQYSLDLAEELARHGVTVLLATMGPAPSEEQQRRAAAIDGLKLAIGDFALEWMPGALAGPDSQVDAAGRWLLELAHEFAPDLIHLNGYGHAALPWGKPVVTVAHSCVYSWWRAVHDEAPPAEWSEYKRRVTQGLAASGAVVCPSGFMAAALELEYGFSRNRSLVIHNFSRTAAATLCATKENFILAAGRFWDKAKNLALLDEAAPQLSWEIRVAGSEANAAAHSVRFLGVLPYADLLDQMNKAAIFAHPALYEPFGLANLEAARRGCCLVLADIPSLHELWGAAAVFLDPCDPSQWIAALERLIADPAERFRLGQLAIAQSARFSVDESGAAYHNLYLSLLASARPGKKETAA